MKKRSIAYYLAFLVVLGLLSCEDEFKKYYEKGVDQKSIIEVLEEKGDYSLFLDALDALKYREILSTSGLFTVLAVNDADFKKYLSDNGYSSISDIPTDELNAIVTYHILDWAFSSSDLITGYSSEKYPNNPLMVRKLTRMAPPVYKEFDKTVSLERTVASELKLMPFFSQSYIDEMGISNQDILDFYPNLNVDLPGGDIIASDGKLMEKDIVASNGWVHRIDRVCTVLPNHQDILYSESDFSLYKNLADEFAEYKFNQGYTDDLELDEDGNGDNDSVFVKTWFQFNREYVGVKGTKIGNETDMKNVQKNFVTAFIPNDAALQQFFTTYYPTIPIENLKSDIAKPALRTIVSSCVFSGIAYFPSYVSSGQLKTKFGTPYIVSDGDISKKEMLSNGLFYGVNSFRVPDEFNAVTKAFMTDSAYSYFLVALDKIDFLKLLVSESIDFTIFSLKNSTFRDMDYYLNDKQDGFVDDMGKAISTGELKDMLKNHIILGKLDIPNLGGTLFVNNIVPEEEYVRISGNNISANGIDISQLLDNGSEIENGLIYEVNSFLIPVETSIVEYLRSTSKYSTFYNKLLEVGIIKESKLGRTIIFNDGKLTCFAPTNTALSGVEFPDNPDELKEFLSRYFVKKVIFTDGQKQGQYETYAKYDDGGLNKSLMVNIATNSGVITVTNQLTGDSSNTEYEDDAMLFEGSLHTLNTIY